MTVQEKEYRMLMRKALEERKPFRPMENGVPVTGAWHRIPMPDRMCANGEEYCLYLKKGSSRNTIIYLIGGGLMWNEKTAGYPSTPATLFSGNPCLYTSEVSPANDYWFFALRPQNGILSMDERNPFRDWNIGMINYGTGDFHLGQRDFEIEDEQGNRKTVHCQGLKNLHACMQIFTKYFPEPEKILIAGESAGGFAVPGAADEILSYYPDCQDITLYTDSSIALRDDRKRIAEDLWNIPKYLADGIYGKDIVADWYERFLAAHKGKNEKLRCLFSCGKRDVDLARFGNYMEGGAFEVTEKAMASFPGLLAEQHERLSALTSEFGFYYHDFPDESGRGSQHITLSFPTFLEGKEEGISPAQWLQEAIDGRIRTVGLSNLEDF